MILITGASGGIGSFLLEMFLEQGDPVMGLYHHTQPEFHQELYHQLDITAEHEIEKFVNSRRELLSHLVLINSAGTSYNAYAHKSDSRKWIEVIITNLIGTYMMCKHMLPLMRAQRYGRIINMSSVVGGKGVPGTSAYASSKAALSGLTKCLAAENASLGITVNNLNLGYMSTGMINEVPPRLRDEIKRNLPTGEFGTPDNVYQAIRFLIQSDYTNGADIAINGGLL